MTVTSPTAGPVGYAWIRDHLGLPSFLGPREARIANVNSIERSPEGSLRIPRALVPEATLLAHILFALKHEDLNLHLLARALREVPADDLITAFATSARSCGIHRRSGSCLQRIY